MIDEKDWEWVGKIFAGFAVAGLAFMMVCALIGVKPQEAWAWVQGAPQQAQEVSQRVGGAVAGTRCALHPCEDSQADERVTGRRPATAEGPYPVTKVSDGDTLRVRIGDKIVTVRTLGMDTPETRDPRKPVQCYGREATARATKLLTGQKVWLEYDASQGRTDKYGRTLAYVWLGGSIFQQTMLREGYAHEYTYDRKAYARQKQFRATEAEAKAAKRGLWASSTCNGDTQQPAR